MRRPFVRIGLDAPMTVRRSGVKDRVPGLHDEGGKRLVAKLVRQVHHPRPCDRFRSNRKRPGLVVPIGQGHRKADFARGAIRMDSADIAADIHAEVAEARKQIGSGHFAYGRRHSPMKVSDGDVVVTMNLERGLQEDVIVRIAGLDVLLTQVRPELLEERLAHFGRNHSSKHARATCRNGTLYQHTQSQGASSTLYRARMCGFVIPIWSDCESAATPLSARHYQDDATSKAERRDHER